MSAPDFIVTTAGGTLQIYASPAEALDRLWAPGLPSFPTRLKAVLPMFYALLEREHLHEAETTEASPGEAPWAAEDMIAPIPWTVDLNLVDNAEIQAVNLQYRNRDEATDVLSFPVFEGIEGIEALSVFSQLPLRHLGDIVVSYEWAVQETRDLPGNKTGLLTQRYLVERVVHGLLHLHGIHHDSMEDYHRVVALQQQMLEYVFSDVFPGESPLEKRLDA